MMNPMMNPNGMVDMLKGNMAFMVPNIAMMGLISYFFAGFVLGMFLIPCRILEWYIQR